MTVEDGMPMSTPAPSVRFVTCPKCRRVLQESADVPIYRCGGCGVILQAKHHRKNDDLKVMEQDHQTPKPRDESISVNGEEHFTSKEEKPSCEDEDQLESRGNDELNSDHEATKGSDLKAKEMHTSGSSSVDDIREKPVEEITPPEREVKLKGTSSRAYNRRMSMETTASTEYVDPVSDFSGSLAETPRTPDGDLPHYDVPETRHLNRRGKEAESAITRERFNPGKYRMNSDSEIRCPEITSRPPLSSFQEDGFIRAAGRRVRDRMVYPGVRDSEAKQWRLDRVELPPRIPANPWQQRSYYDYGGPSNPVPMYSRFNSGIHPGDVPTHPEQEKMKLLKMVHDLEDQLKRSYNLEEIPMERMPPGLHWRERQGDDFNHVRDRLPAYSRISERDSRWRHRHRHRHRHHSRYPARPFSADIVETSRRHSNFYHHQAHWRRSEPLPPPAAANDRKFSGIRNDRSVYSLYSSSPSSPQHYMDYGFSPYGYDTRSEDEVYDEEKEYGNYRPMAKRPVMAAAGGAPWIICSRCSRLLQLPTDFLLFKKRRHRLRCGSCSTVLKFSLQNARQLVPDERGDSLRADSLDAEGLPDSVSSPLHRLMGYSSVSQVFRGPEPSAKDASP